MVSCPVLLQFYKELLCNDYDSFSSVTITIHVVSGSVLDSLVAVKYKYNSKKKISSKHSDSEQSRVILTSFQH